MAKIRMLAAYERARRTLHGVYELPHLALMLRCGADKATEHQKSTIRNGWFGRISPMAKIRMLAAYERARRTLHGVYELPHLAPMLRCVADKATEHQKKAPSEMDGLREFRLWRRYACLRLTSELDALCTAYTNSRIFHQCFDAGPIKPRNTKKAPPEMDGAFLVTRGRIELPFQP